MTRRLEEANDARQEVQADLDGKKTSQERNKLGQFATPPALALEMAELAGQFLPARGPVRFLDPAVGTGVFFYAARKELGDRISQACGFELDPAFAAAAARLWGSCGLDIRVEDFTAAVPTGPVSRSDLILCNPPYVRHHHLSAEQKVRLGTEVRRQGHPLSGLAGLYCYFLALTHRWMNPNAVAVWIVPAEFLDVNYGRSVKRYLTTDVTLYRVHRFDPDDVQFADALVSSVVVALANRVPPIGHTVALTTGGRLTAPQSVRSVPLAALAPKKKWGPLFTPRADRAVAINRLIVGDLFSVRRGLATGANDYFILPRSEARRLALPRRFLRPILPSPRHVPGSVVEANDDGFPLGLPDLVLLDCNLDPDRIESQYPDLARYLEKGREQGIPGRYLAAHRKLWYAQETRPPAPILCTYLGRQRGGRSLRFIRNRSAATAPNVYLMLYPKGEFASLVQRDPAVLDRAFEALTEATTELSAGGRVYGGGLNKIEPKELEAIELPESFANRYAGLLGILTPIYKQEEFEV